MMLAGHIAANAEIRMRQQILMAISALILASQARAEVRISETSSNYELRGLSTAAIHDDIMKRAPREGSGVIDGDTSDRLSLSFKYATEDQACRVAKDTVHLEINTTLPVWIDEQRADPAVRAAWNDYLLNLRGHENGHKTIAVTAAQRIDQLIHNTKPAKTCAELEASLSSEARKIQEQAEAEQDRYDQQAQSFDIE